MDCTFFPSAAQSKESFSPLHLCYNVKVFFSILQCVLSGIILVALKGMYTQAGQLPRYFREGKLEGLTWIVTFSAVVLVDVDIG